MKGVALAALVVGLSACSDSSKDIQYGQGTYTLQGVVMNAVTGARIGGDLKLYLIQGPDVRGPTRFISDSSDPLVGEYAFTGIPAEYDWSGAKTYKVVAVKSGFERFEGEINFEVQPYEASNGSTIIVDTNHNLIGNIYLFPTGTPTPDYNVTVFYQGKPVPKATVLIDPIVSNNSALFAQTNNTLYADNGYIASLSATTDANGRATFAGKDLALGAGYQIQVLPQTFTDSAGTTVQLARATGGTFQPGLSVTEQIVNVGDLTPTANTVYVTSASNKAAGQLTPSGALTITFNAPVVLVNPNAFGAVLTAGTNAAGTAAGAGILNVAGATTQPVIATLSGDGLTLTLAPSYQTAPAAGDRGVAINYGNGTALVAPKDYPSQTLAVFGGLKLADGSNVSGAVSITAP
jgi:hypothetical protein